jgi:hypothetical protein
MVDHTEAGRHHFARHRIEGEAAIRFSDPSQQCI